MFGIPATAPPGGIALAAAITVAAAVGIGVVYGYALSALPVVHIVTLAAAPAFGLIIAVAAEFGFKLGRVRHSTAGLTIVMIGAVIGLYASWAAWVCGLIGEPDLLALASRPLLLLDVIAGINEAGPWSIRNWRPTGLALSILWLVEAGCIVGMARKTAITNLQKLSDRPFCPACNNWIGPAEGLANFGLGDPDEVRQHVRDRDWEYFSNLGISYDVDNANRLSLTQCKCGALRCATLERATRRPDSVRERALIAQHVLLTADEVQRLRAAASNAHQPPVPRRRGRKPAAEPKAADGPGPSTSPPDAEL